MRDEAHGVAIQIKSDSCNEHDHPLKALSVDGLIDLASADIAILGDRIWSGFEWLSNLPRCMEVPVHVRSLELDQSYTVELPIFPSFPRDGEADGAN